MAGFEPIVVDYCEDRDLIAITHRHISMRDENWPELVRGEFPDLPLLITGGMEHQLAAIDSLLQGTSRPACSISQLEQMRRLSHWARWAKLCGIGWPETWTTVEIDANEALRNQLVAESTQGQSWLLKSTRGVGGMHTHDLLADHSWLNMPDSVYAQRKLPGETIGVTFASSEYGSIVLGAAASLGPGSQAFMPKYVYRGSCGPFHELTETAWMNLHSFATLVGRSTGYAGLWQADFLLNQDELTLLEINPRWSASMELLDSVYELGLVALHVDCVCRSIDGVRWKAMTLDANRWTRELPSTMLGKLVAYASKDICVSEEQSKTWWQHRWTGNVSGIGDRVVYADIPRPKTLIATGEPILTCFALGDSLAGVQHKLEEFIADL